MSSIQSSNIASMSMTPQKGTESTTNGSKVKKTENDSSLKESEVPETKEDFDSMTISSEALEKYKEMKLSSSESITTELVDNKSDESENVSVIQGLSEDESSDESNDITGLSESEIKELYAEGKISRAQMDKEFQRRGLGE